MENFDFLTTHKLKAIDCYYRHLHHSIRHGPGRLKKYIPSNQSPPMLRKVMLKVLKMGQFVCMLYGDLATLGSSTEFAPRALKYIRSLLKNIFETYKYT